MHEIWIAAGVAIAGLAVAVPFAAIIVVSIASRREEAAQSLSRSAPGATARAARRLLEFRSGRSALRPAWATQHHSRRAWRARRSGRRWSSLRLAPGTQQDGPAPSPPSWPLHEVRFDHARRSLSDTSQFAADDQSQPSSIRSDERQGAGV